MSSMSLVAELVLDIRNAVGECPTWDWRHGALWWTDINARKLHRFQPSSALLRSFDTPGRVGSFALCEGDDLILAMEAGFTRFDVASGQMERLDQPEDGMEHHRFNDGRCDRAGRFLAGSMNLAKSAVSGKLWSLGHTGRATVVAGGVTVANGLAFSPDGKTMFWADSPADTVFSFDYDLETGAASNRRVWLEPRSGPGRPDGAAVDTDGCYWSARWGGGAVVRFTPEGKIDRFVTLPAGQVAMCAFGGPDLRTLYITTARDGLDPAQLSDDPLAGALFAVDPGSQGMPEPCFKSTSTAK